MEKAIGDKFRYLGYTLIVVEDASDEWEDSCGKCAIACHGCANIVDKIGFCACDVRRDGKSVHFELACDSVESQEQKGGE